MTHESNESAPTRRALYLDAAFELRKKAIAAQSTEAHETFMRLAILYQELAEYSAIGESALQDPPRSCH